MMAARAVIGVEVHTVCEPAPRKVWAVVHPEGPDRLLQEGRLGDGGMGVSGVGA